jgi:hypothetical protein
MTKIEGTLFVFYMINKDATTNTWTYGRFPNSWTWVGSGGTGKKGFPAEEQFSGNKKNIKKMRAYLDKYFIKLKRKKIITKFKIRNSYLP